jgi:hypothetical protein
MTRVFEREYEITAEINGDSGSVTLPKAWEHSYIKRVAVVGASIAVAGTVNLKTTAVPGRAQRTLWTSAITTGGIEDRPYEVVQNTSGADITNTAQRIAVSQGERLVFDATSLSTPGTVNLSLSRSR